MTAPSQSPFRPRLFLHAWQLRDADAGALRLFLNLLRNRLQAEWVLGEAVDPMDLLVMPAAGTVPQGVDPQSLPGLVRLNIAADAAEAASAAAPVLQRPLQFEDVAALLLDIEPGLIGTAAARRPVAAPPVPVVLEPAVPAEPVVPPVFAEALPEPAAAPLPAVEPVSVGRTVSRPTLELTVGERVRLRRWPDPVQLQGRRGHHRLASQIASTALERDDLLALSGLPAVEVDAFLEAMHRADLLEVLPPESVSGEAAMPSSTAPEPVPGSLFGLIRRRLGIGNS